MENKYVRLIDGNALLEMICKKCPEDDCEPDATDTVSGCLIYDVIASAPTIDAQPVKHGRWIPNTSLPGQTGFHCSECMFTDKGTYSRRFKRYKRCPNCGAYMRGEEDA